MNALQHLSRGFICCVLTGGALFSCKRDIPASPTVTESAHAVTFKLSGFESDIVPLSKSSAVDHPAFGRLSAGMLAQRNIEPSPESQYVYYWSFNDETLEPDIAVDEVGAEITFEAATEPDFGSGFGLAPVEAGQAWSVPGAQTVEFNLPLYDIESLTTFAFDISSSNTGPKDFLLTYSVDGGDSYEVLSANNQFGNMGAQSRNQYAFDLNIVSEFVGTVALKIKIEFLPGNRGSAGDYNGRTGVVKLDNIRLSGVYTGAPTGDPSAPSTLRYYIFSADDGHVVKQQELPMDELSGDGTMEILLTEGAYDIVFLAYRSRGELLLPDEVNNARDFYFGQHFDDHEAITYASFIRNVEVTDADIEETVTLERCYSLVAFDFTDIVTDLLAVKKITVTRLHDNYLYTPFGETTEQPITNVQTIVFSGFRNAEDYRIAFHQFLGIVPDVRQVNYEVIAYGEEDELLNSVTIDEQITNSVRLTFSGRLTGGAGRINGFNVVLDATWRDDVEKAF
ncbi:hypothetical protein [Parapedobacter koreensis]|uniref:Uncharacterized protein n=1 Tax=Parapedobacter koreensis TaxID=332977 RepID=A0A1H7GB39_9SPHI|nr:hypothetical protein [Parapedobacter koreensis]SEK33700.1 hypothetical protein SAMN05421740_101589 [Parapedobacter koreensis]